MKPAEATTGREGSLRPAEAGTLREAARLGALVESARALAERELQKDPQARVLSDHLASPRAVVAAEQPIGLLVLGAYPENAEEALDPFQGEHGALLDKILAAINTRREEIHLCYALGRRPAPGQQAEEHETAAARPALKEKLGLLRPRVICALGSLATRALLGDQGDMSQAHGKITKWGKSLVIPTYSLQEVLRDAGLKRPVWEDMKRVRQELEKS